MNSRVHLLGEVQVFDGEERYCPRPDKRIALLGYLACKGGEWVEREKLAFLFWPDIDNENARTNLRSLLARCRTLPFSRDLEAEANRLRWPVESDVDAFRRAIADDSWDQAIELYRGRLFGDANFDDSGEFTTWLEMVRAGLEESYRTAVFRRAELLSGSGNRQEAVRVLEALLRHEPLDEEAVQLLMRLLAESGKPELASRHYRNFRRSLKERLGLDPSSATEQLEQANRMRSDEPVPSAGTVSVGSNRQKNRTEGTPTGNRNASAAVSIPLNAFVGRRQELRGLTELLDQTGCRLVTLTGPAGVGKTRLALQALEELRGRYPDGVYFVPLEAASSANAAALALAATTKTVLHGTDDALGQVARSLGDRRVLLVLDNCEQLLDSATSLAALLATCPHLELLVTSRERLGLAEEWLMPLEGFTFPTSNVPVDEAHTFDAVSFFGERARQVRPDFRIGVTELPHVLDLCRLVEGLPLGLEMAAVWVRVMPTAEIAQEVRHGLDLLSNSNRNVPDRHRSIRAAFEHSWSLLADREKVVMRKLAAFRGGFRRDAAAFVAGATIPILAALVDKSLLRVSAEGRYDRHPLLYQFSAEKLAEHPDEEREARDRHAHYFASLSEEAGKNDYTPQQAIWLARIEAEYDNLRTALDWIETGEQAELGLRLVGSLNWYWGWRGIVAEPREWFRRVLAIPGAKPTSARAKALRGAGLKASLQGEVELGRELANEALAIAREVGDGKTEILALLELSDVAFLSGEPEVSEKLLSQVLALSRELADDSIVSLCLAETGALYTFLGRYEEAEVFIKESLLLTQALGDVAGIAVRKMILGRISCGRGEIERGRSLLLESLEEAKNLQHAFIRASCLLSLGIVAADEGDFGQARSYLRECLEVWWEAGMTWRVGQALEAFAVLATAEGGVRRAALLWGAAEALRGVHSAHLNPPEQERHDRAVLQARCLIDEEAFGEFWEQGRAMDLRRAVEFTLEQ